MAAFGLTPNVATATSNWEVAHGHGIDFYQYGTCFGSTIRYRSIQSNECGVPPPGIQILGCWMPIGWTYVSGIPAATSVNIYHDTLWYDAYATSAQKTHNLAHETGHGMALAHHANCTNVMSTGVCTNVVQVADVDVPRCVYGYTC
jgi:hypothetical protein